MPLRCATASSSCASWRAALFVLELRCLLPLDPGAHTGKCLNHRLAGGRILVAEGKAHQLIMGLRTASPELVIAWAD